MPHSNRLTSSSLLLFAGIFVALASAIVHAQTGTMKKIKDSGSITIGHRESSIPFSYLDEKQRPVGYSIDLCMAVVEEVKKELGLANLEVKMNPVTSQTRIPLLTNGAIDIECGSTTNTLSRQRQVSFAPITFITGTKLLVRKSSRVKNYADLKGRTVAVTQGTTNERLLRSLSEKENLGIKFVVGKDHNESTLAVISGRAAAFAMDDILLFGQIALSAKPKELEVVGDYLSYEPYGIMYRRGDTDLAVAINRALSNLFRSGDINKLYDKWFMNRLPDGSIIGMPMSPMLKAAFTVQALPE
jgi:glutamate/aspartate transport system substrate-binding protein